jgi:2-keto-myo-inositol isomerase
MKTCFNTITAGRDKPLEEIIRRAGQVGFDGLELAQGHIADCLNRMPINELRSRLEEAGLQAASIMAFNLAPFDDPGPGIAKIKEGTQYAHDLGAPLLLVFCAADIPKGMSADEALERAAERVADYAEVAYPVAIGLEPIGRTTLMGGPAAALDIAARSGKSNVGMVMDTFHFYRSQVPEGEVRAIPPEKLLLVHINDAEDLPVEQLRDAHRLHVGRGVLPLPGTLAILNGIGYNGFLSVEIFREEYWRQPVEQVIHEAKSSLDMVLSKAGIILGLDR